MSIKNDPKLDPYGRICEAMSRGLLITVNESDSSAKPSGELEVKRVAPESFSVFLEDRDGNQYQLKYGPSPDPVLTELDPDGSEHSGRECPVTTIEVIGIASE